MLYKYEQLEKLFNGYAYIYLNWMTNLRRWYVIRNNSAKSMEFPFTEYRFGQRQLAVNVYKAIRDEHRIYISAPTGIGKTMGTLFPAIKALGEGIVDRIFYLTAKTITKSVVTQAYKLLSNNGLNLRTVVITAKDKVCPFEVRKCDPMVCDKANGYYERMPQARKEMLKEQYFDRETINKYAMLHNICPFELSLDIANYSDLIICDYNYVFDPKVKLHRFFDEVKENYCFLVDEAHNLVDRGRSMFSAEILKSDILRLKRKTNPKWEDVKKRLTKVNNEINILKKKYFDSIREGYYQESEIEGRLVTAVKRTATIMEKYFDYDMTEEYLDIFLDVYFKLYYFSKAAELYDERYKSFYVLDKNDLSIKLMCIDPSYLLSKAMDNGINTTLFSATLEPKRYYMDVLGSREFDKSMSLYSPFPKENLKVIVEGRISTKYKDRDMTYDKIAMLLKKSFNEKIGNYIVYFPSYKYLNSVLEIYKSIETNNEILVQKRNMDEFEREIFIERFNNHGKITLVAFAVMGGIFGEGIDLEGEKLNGVVIVGTGLPMICPEKEMIKDYYDIKLAKGFDYSYIYPGINRVLQAAGRVIRTENDRGFVILIDSRFAGARYRQLFPTWWDVEFFTYQDKNIHNSLSRFYTIWYNLNMELITTTKMKEAEDITINKYGISSLLLMENAANGVFKILEAKFQNLKSKKIAIFCGPGNNGGDGYAVARKLHILGCTTTIFSTINIVDLKKDAKYNADICNKLGILINEKVENIDIKEYDIIVDGLLGTGISREVQGVMKYYIDSINNTKAYKVSIDIPSGLQGNSGNIFNKVVFSDLTITFGKGKIGLYTQPGFKYSKEIKVVNIDIPSEVYNKVNLDTFYYTKTMAINYIKPRKAISSKGNYGRVMVIVGSKGMLGAYKLCTTSIMSAGAGYTYALVPSSKIYEYNSLVSEVICIGIEDNNKQYLTNENAKEVIGKLNNIDSMVIGPGLDNKSNINLLIKEILDNTDMPIVIDAKAITDISNNLDIIKNRRQKIILTPHPGEMAKLINSSIEYVQNNRIKVAKKFAKEYGTILLLKGHKSIVTDGDKVYINNSGNAGMATAGSGDVLAGIIGAKIAKNSNVLETVAYCMYIHGYSGDIAKKKYGENGLTATKIIENFVQAERVIYEEKAK